MASRDYFKNKRIAVIGLGPQGEMADDVRFLIKAGALVSVYDLRSEARLKDHLLFLRSIGLANYVCGHIPAEDLLDMDLIILSHEYPRDSSFLKNAKDIQVEYPETLFFKIAPPVTLVGVMGSCGKSTVISILEPLLETACSSHEGQGFFVIDPESKSGILSHLKKVKSSDIILARMVPKIMKELAGMRISPHVAVFTTVPSVGSYDKFPFEILNYQTYNNFIVGTDQVIDSIHASKNPVKAKMLRTKSTLVPLSWGFEAKTEYDRDNGSLALQTAQLFKITDDDARPVFQSWKPLKGRLEFVKKVKNVEFYNDTASICPHSTGSAVQALSEEKNIILIVGGADGGWDYGLLHAIIPRFVRTLILIPGSGTIKERKAFSELGDTEICSVSSVEEAVTVAMEHAQKGDKVLFSPAFEVGGFDNSRKERGERFVKAVRGL